MKTALCERLGIGMPIVLAPMAGAIGPQLAAAVSNAGGLGTLPLWSADIDTLRRQVRETHALTTRPFAVNLNLNFPQDDRLDACLEEGVRVFSFFWRDPSALVARAKRAGGIVLQGCAVRGLETKGGRVSGVVTEKGPIACDSVVLAGGAWSRLFAGNVGIDLPQLKVLGQGPGG